MSDEETSPDNSLVAAALELPMSHYLHWSRHEQVAAALALFKTEREIRKTGRLDLVTWVQYICGFGYPGPSESAWAQLFSACRVIPSLHPGRTYLREHEIAVLLAYAKITPDNGDSMTPAQLVKHRIKPAVLGRSVARTPGILYHIHHKFENWALGPFTDMYCALCVSLCCPEPFPPPNLPAPNTLSDIGDTIRQSATAHTNATLKSWGSVMTSVLDIDINNKSARLQRFEAKLHEKRRFIYQQLYVKISEQWLRSATSAGLQSQSRFDHSQHSDCTPQPSLNDFSSKSPQFLDVRDAREKADASFPSRTSIPSWSVVDTEVVVCQLHRSSRYGQAALDFIPSEASSPQNVNYAQHAAPFAPSKTYLRIGSSNPPSLCAEVGGIPLSHACRGLALRLKVGVLPPRVGSQRPRFEIVGIESVSWVELSAEQDKCFRHDVLRKDGDHGNDAAYVGENAGMRRQAFDLSRGLRKHEIQVNVPKRLLRRLRMETRIAEDCGESSAVMKMEDLAHTAGTHASCASLDLGLTLDDDGCERFREQCWIDWHTNAVVTYVTPGPSDRELYAVTAAKTDMLHISAHGRSGTP